jgi:phage tail sheath protein FI
MPTYDVPGVYIEEQTSPGVIAGVGTSTAAFIGPAVAGPIKEARRISSYDEFLSLYAITQDGILWPYITSQKRFFMANAVQGFYENGGKQAYIVRVGTGLAAWLNVKNQAGEDVFRIQAMQEGIAGNNVAVQVQAANATTAAGAPVARGLAKVQSINGTDVTVDNAGHLRVGDYVTEDETARARIMSIQGNVLALSGTIAGLAANDTLRIANIIPVQLTFRVTNTTGLYPGSVVVVSGDDADNPGTVVTEYGVIASMDRAAGFVTLAASPARTKKFNVTAAAAPVLISQEFRLIITPPGGSATAFDNLSLNPLHPNYVFVAVDSDWVSIKPPSTLPVTFTFPQTLVQTTGANPVNLANGKNDDPSAVTATEYGEGLKVLRDVDEVNILCIPDAAANADCLQIQKDMINHCVLLKDRFAILDSRLGAPPSGPGSVETHRQQVESPNGFAALYYPWLTVRERLLPSAPRPSEPRTIFVPPSGHMAGVYARTDGERGVHKAPANTDVRGILGLERLLSDGQQGPLNEPDGIDVLRIFPGSGQVTIWGARTTVRSDITDWRYVNIRRLMLYIEESIQEGIRWAVFEPNNLGLWNKLKRTIGEFLTRVWRDGALFGATAEKAFYVRIDEALNTPATQALGRLYIEIGVRPSYPAEFIIVRIGLWDGGAEITEG